MPNRKTTAAKAKKSTAIPRRKSAVKPTPARAVTKQATVIAMLSGKGATIPAVMKATGWQQHSVRGFFAGIVRKKLKLNLVSEAVDGIRVYRIGKTAPKQESPKTTANPTIRSA